MVGPPSLKKVFCYFLQCFFIGNIMMKKYPCLIILLPVESIGVYLLLDMFTVPVVTTEHNL